MIENEGLLGRNLVASGSVFPGNPVARAYELNGPLDRFDGSNMVTASE